MEKINQNDERLAKEVNYEYSGTPAKEEFSEWSEEVEERADNPYHKGEKKHSESEAEREKKLKEMDEIVKEDIKNAKR